MLTLLFVLIAVAVLGAAAIVGYAIWQPREKFILDTDRMTKAALVDKTSDKLTFAFDVPYINNGKDEAVVLDAFVRVYLPVELYDKALVRGKIYRKEVKREDDYFEAWIWRPNINGDMTVQLELTPLNGATLAEAVAGLPDFDAALYWECRGRGLLYTIKKYVTINAAEIKALL